MDFHDRESHEKIEYPDVCRWAVIEQWEVAPVWSL